MAVKTAYFKLLKATTKLLATVEQHELRCTLQREIKSEISFGSKVHEIISPMIYLCLECNYAAKLSIHFGFELFQGDNEYSYITSRFLRMLYKLTAVEHTGINIEDCVNTEYVLTSCSELYEIIEDSSFKEHTFKLIKHKVTIAQRKQRLSVA
ncbi:hypothetical protein [Mucilaginibacter sp. SG564]|uniref:hypothetical protein n=1 Tax=Mucilaginibacter sp. SG564 TaxID=2587022 RepID=UPI0015572197|nr:hypothetical protein [Mucilaginibacter sp. SG564]NOW99173.1 hypothetical protein [Mucilaginibacter sp. SG564]